MTVEKKFQKLRLFEAIFTVNAKLFSKMQYN